MENLQACLDCTDWEIFRSATNSLDEYTEAVMLCISFCADSCISSCTKVSYNNDKPWFTAKLRKLQLEKETAFRSGDRDKFKESKYKFSKAIRDGRETVLLQYSETPDLTVISLFNGRYQHTSVPFIWASSCLLNLLVGSGGSYQPFLSVGRYFSEPVQGEGMCFYLVFQLY